LKSQKSPKFIPEASRLTNHQAPFQPFDSVEAAHDLLTALLTRFITFKTCFHSTVAGEGLLGETGKTSIQRTSGVHSKGVLLPSGAFGQLMDMQPPCASLVSPIALHQRCHWCDASAQASNQTKKDQSKKVDDIFFMGHEVS